MTLDDGPLTLQEMLADLYPASNDARRIAAQSGILLARVNVNSSPISGWGSILEEAARCDRLSTLVDQAAREFPNRALALQRALEVYSTIQERETPNKGGWGRLKAQVNEHLNEIVIGIVVTLISAWILELITNWPLLAKLIAMLEFGMILTTPLLIQAGLSRLSIVPRKGALLALSILFIAGQAAFYSWLPVARAPKLPEAAEPVSDFFEENDRYLHSANYSDLHVKSEDVRIVRTLHILAEVEWRKWERPKESLLRRYSGELYYTVEYVCSDTGEVEVGDPIPVGYQLRPGSGVLGKLVGFVEIPFVLDANNEISEGIREVLKANAAICP
jgi:hypothetical protein